MIDLNPEQQQAANHYEGPCIITAVPGSGKTATLTARILRLMERGVSPKNIMAVTFTNKAAQEMKERVLSGNPQARHVWISTFHRLSLRLIRNHSLIVGLKYGFTIWNQDDAKAMMSKVHRMWAARHGEDGKIHPVDRNNLLNRIDCLRESAEPFDVSLEDDRLGLYLKELKDNNAVDFSGMLYLGWKILTKSPEIARKLSEKYKFILVDEAQDTNDIQYAIAKILASHENLFMVGDYQQSIFSWRGAKPENIEKFQKDFANTVAITLPRNYRSRQEILEHAENLIWKNSNAGDVSLVSERGSGGNVSVGQYETDRAEASEVIYRIQQFRAQGYDWKDIAIIYRLNRLSQILEVALTHSNIPYVTRGGPSFFNRKEIKTTLSYLKLLMNPADSNAFKEAVSNPKRGVGEVLIGKIDNLAKEKGITVTEAATKVKPKTKVAKAQLIEFVAFMDRHRYAKVGLAETAENMMRESGYRAQLEKDAKDGKDGHKSGMRVDNLDTFIGGIGQYESESENPSLNRYLQQVALIQDGDNPKRKDSVSLLTMHSAKGLEFPCVFVVGCSASVVPHYLAVNEGREEEERRLFYVAITRAKDNLHVSFHESVPFKNMFQDPSPYLEDMMDRS